MNMVKIINWLRSVELLAGNVYLEASEKFAADQEFSSFLSRLSQDETWHAFLLGKALQAIQDKESLPKFGIRIDSVTKEEIEAPFKDLYYLINKQNLSKKELVNCIVKAEFSEWNSIFLYAIKLVANFTTNFQHTAATIESHKGGIQKFLEDLPEGIKPPDNLTQLTNIWERKILIVDEDTSFREFLSDLLKSMGEIEEVANGWEGLEKVKDTFFNVIVSEVKIEKTSGIEFYQKAIELNPNISRNFLFCSDEISPESKAFFQDNHLTYLEKPVSIRRLIQIVQDIIDKTL
ncbi:response regulator [Thermodesulfobacteriota bacterium]